ncbi:hypothetical protein [Nonomuraea sp. B19D2]|uniref:hypothetical protein n=1 Tax=Nonomuraea sp. B19D2 TaxID=3159561 RepID=UPI0032DB410D
MSAIIDACHYRGGDMGGRFARINSESEWVLLVPDRKGINSFVDSEIDPVQLNQEVYRSECPFCPPSHLAKSSYDTLIFPNEYPLVNSADLHGKLLSEDGHPIAGVNDVVIYTSKHNEYLHKCSVDQIANFFARLRDRHIYHYSTVGLRSIFTFMAVGARFGPSQLHPHGQLLGMPFTPQRIDRILGPDADSCMVCSEQNRAKEREYLVWESDNISAYMTTAPRVPYELWISTKRHGIGFVDQDDRGCIELAEAVWHCLYATQAHTFNPYLVAIFDVAPTSTNKHLRLEIMAFGRPNGADKYLGAFELSLGVYINPTDPRDIARTLRYRLNSLNA